MIGTSLQLWEEIVLGSPIPCPTTLAICDRRGCDHDALVLIDGAWFCERCAAGFGIGRDGPFAVPVEELRGDESWRAGRSALYRRELRRLNRLHPRERTPALERVLRERLDAWVASAIADALCEER